MHVVHGQAEVMSSRSEEVARTDASEHMEVECQRMNEESLDIRRRSRYTTFIHPFRMACGVSFCHFKFMSLHWQGLPVSASQMLGESFHLGMRFVCVFCSGYCRRVRRHSQQKSSCGQLSAPAF